MLRRAWRAWSLGSRSKCHAPEIPTHEVNPKLNPNFSPQPDVHIPSHSSRHAGQASWASAGTGFSPRIPPTMCPDFGRKQTVAPDSGPRSSSGYGSCPYTLPSWASLATAVSLAFPLSSSVAGCCAGTLTDRQAGNARLSLRCNACSAFPFWDYGTAQSFKGFEKPGWSCRPAGTKTSRRYVLRASAAATAISPPGAALSKAGVVAWHVSVIR